MKKLLIAITFASIQFIVSMEQAKEVLFVAALLINSIFLTDLTQFSFVDKLINLFQLLFFKGFFLEYLLFRDGSYYTTQLRYFALVTIIFHFLLGNRWGSSKLTKLNSSSRFALILLDKISQSFSLAKVYHHLIGKESTYTLIFAYTILLAWGQLVALVIGLAEYVSLHDAFIKTRAYFIDALILYISGFAVIYTIEEYYEYIKVQVPVNMHSLTNIGITTVFIFVYTILSLSHDKQVAKKKVD